MKKPGFTTTALNVPFAKTDPHNSLQMPLYETVAFEFDSAEQMEANFKGQYPAHTYSRTSSPTLEYFELKLKALTSGHAVLAVSSGMAAISSALTSIASAGDNIITSRHLFGHTLALFQQTLHGFGIEARLSSLQDMAETEALIDENTRAIYFETVSNPQLEIAEINDLAALAQKHHLLLIADSTITPPNVFQASRFGVNIEVISTTKFISGGATAFGGAIIDHGNYNWTCNPHLAEYTAEHGKNAFIVNLRKNIYRNTGPTMTPQTAKLMSQGLDILELRVERCYQNCLALGSFFEQHPKVVRVNYPGLKSDSGYQRAKTYFNGIPGTVMTFDLESAEACFKFMNRLRIIRRATNLNDNKTLILHPATTINAELSEAERSAAGIRETMMRLSVGIENVGDLINDLNQALK